MNDNHIRLLAEARALIGVQSAQLLLLQKRITELESKVETLQLYQIEGWNI